MVSPGATNTATLGMPFAKSHFDEPHFYHDIFWFALHTQKQTNRNMSQHSCVGNDTRRRPLTSHTFRGWVVGKARRPARGAFGGWWERGVWSSSPGWVLVVFLLVIWVWIFCLRGATGSVFFMSLSLPGAFRRLAVARRKPLGTSPHGRGPSIRVHMDVCVYRRECSSGRRSRARML